MHVTRKVKAPKADFVRSCHKCGGSGRSACQFCSGSGYILKRRDIRGMPVTDRCTACFGNKLARCYTCGGSGQLHQF